MKKKPTIMDQVQQAQQEVADLFRKYELAVSDGDYYRERSIAVWEDLEDATRSYRQNTQLIDVLRDKIDTYTSLATMSYARAAAIKP